MKPSDVAFFPAATPSHSSIEVVWLTLRESV